MEGCICRDPNKQKTLEKIDTALQNPNSQQAIQQIDQLIQPLTLEHYNTLQLIWMRDQKYFESQRGHKEISELEEAKEYTQDACFEGKTLSDRFREFYKQTYVRPFLGCPLLKQIPLNPEQTDFLNIHR